MKKISLRGVNRVKKEEFGCLYETLLFYFLPEKLALSGLSAVDENIGMEILTHLQLSTSPRLSKKRGRAR